jgi:hypothetical protein
MILAGVSSRPIRIVFPKQLTHGDAFCVMLDANRGAQCAHLQNEYFVVISNT